ncbi:MAG: HAD family hydrolase [Rhodospirillales bacterium]|nr:HAD family hydrolase [Rhodospirillales bacterium]
MSKPGARCLLIDLDGTLADSLTVMKTTYRRFVEKFGGRPSDEEFSQLNGPTLGEVVRRLQHAHGLPGDHEELMAYYETLLDESYDDVLPMPGAPELLADAKRNKWTLGIVTSNSVVRCRTWLERNELAVMVDLMVCGEDVSNGKPDPEIYLLALERAGCPAQNALAIEDSPQGAVAALAAGIPTIGLTTDPVSPHQWPNGVVIKTSLRQIILPR